MFSVVENNISYPVGSLVRMKSECEGGEWGTGLVVQYLSPHAKAYEPDGMYQVKWSTGPEADTDIEDCWYDARHLELIALPEGEE